MTMRGSRHNTDRQEPSPRPAILLPLGLLMAATVLILTCDLDRGFSRPFFTEDGGWWLYNNWWMIGLYDYGVWPGFVLAGTALAALAASAARPLRRLFRPALFLVLVLAIGPGLVLNATFKAHYGRPRPSTIEDFGRYQEFRNLLEPGAPNGGGSFPSGHAAMGFYLLSPYFLLLHRRRLALLALATGIVAGGLVGFARIAAGDHFLGDVLWAWGFVYFTGLICYYLLRFHRRPPGRY